jgi:hypothetical protein
VLVTYTFLAFKEKKINRDNTHVTGYITFSVVAILLSLVLSAKGLDTPMQHIFWSVRLTIPDGPNHGLWSSFQCCDVVGTEKCGKVCWGWWGISIPTLVVAIVGFVSSISSL